MITRDARRIVIVRALQASMSADQPQNVGLLAILYDSGRANVSGGKQLDEKSSETLTLLNLYKQKYPKLSLR